MMVGTLVLVGCRSTGPSGPLTDNELAVAVMTRLDDDAVTAPFDFGITVIDGVVYLKGNAPPKNAIRARAVSIALGTPGVLEVVDELYPPTNGMY
jgi:osmotically-inducible protein OsmY